MTHYFLKVCTTFRMLARCIEKRSTTAHRPENHLALVYKHESNFSSESAITNFTRTSISRSISNQMTWKFDRINHQYIPEDHFAPDFKTNETILRNFQKCDWKKQKKISDTKKLAARGKPSTMVTARDDSESSGAWIAPKYSDISITSSKFWKRTTYAKKTIQYKNSRWVKRYTITSIYWVPNEVSWKQRWLLENTRSSIYFKGSILVWYNRRQRTKIQLQKKIRNKDGRE